LTHQVTNTPTLQSRWVLLADTWLTVTSAATTVAAATVDQLSLTSHRCQWHSSL